MNTLVTYRNFEDKANRLRTDIQLMKDGSIEKIIPTLNELPMSYMISKGGAYFMAALKTKNYEWVKNVTQELVKTDQHLCMVQGILNLNTNVNVKNESYLPLDQVEDILFCLCPPLVWNKNTLRVLIKNHRFSLVERINQRYPESFSNWEVSYKDRKSALYDFHLARLNEQELKTLGMVSWSMLHMDNMGLPFIQKWITTHYIFNDNDIQWLYSISEEIAKTNERLRISRQFFISALEANKLKKKHQHILTTTMIEAL